MPIFNNNNKANKKAKKKYKIEKFKKMKPCYNPELVLGKNWEGTILDLIEKAPVYDSVWTVCRGDFLPEKEIRKFTRWIMNLYEMPYDKDLKRKQAWKKYQETGEDKYKNTMIARHPNYNKACVRILHKASGVPLKNMPNNDSFSQTQEGKAIKRRLIKIVEEFLNE